MELIFLIIQMIVGAGLIGIVLMQRSGGDGMGLGSGSGSNFLSGRQSANLLTRTTAILATIFIVNSLWLGILATHKGSSSIADQIESSVPATDGAPKDAAPETKPDGTPAVPAAEGATPAPADESADKEDESIPAPAAAEETPQEKSSEKPAEKYGEAQKPADSTPAVPAAE